MFLEVILISILLDHKIEGIDVHYHGIFVQNQIGSWLIVICPGNLSITLHHLFVLLTILRELLLLHEHNPLSTFNALRLRILIKFMKPLYWCHNRFSPNLFWNWSWLEIYMLLGLNTLLSLILWLSALSLNWFDSPYRLSWLLIVRISHYELLWISALSRCGRLLFLPHFGGTWWVLIPIKKHRLLA